MRLGRLALLACQALLACLEHLVYLVVFVGVILEEVVVVALVLVAEQEDFQGQEDFQPLVATLVGILVQVVFHLEDIHPVVDQLEVNHLVGVCRLINKNINIGWIILIKIKE